MLLSHDNNCVLCLEEPKDPSRDDDLCEECGDISDKYNFNSDQDNTLELDNGG
jgi:hypothetical protein